MLNHCSNHAVGKQKPCYSHYLNYDTPEGTVALVQNEITVPKAIPYLTVHQTKVYTSVSSRGMPVDFRHMCDMDYLCIMLQMFAFASSELIVTLPAYLSP